jgi:serine/threonine protein kinase
VIKEIAAALSIAHSNGIIHQNLSSENILIRRTPSDAEDVKVMNFGTSPFDINDLDYPVEKAQYLSPEQCSNTSEIDERTDIYSLGIILYEMLAGGVPFTAVSTTDLMLRHVQETPPRITIYRNDLPEQVDDILLKALAKNPEIRFQTAAEFAGELDRVSLLAGDSDEQVTIVNQRMAANTASQNYSQNNLWKTAFIVLAGVSLLGAFFIYMTQGKKTDPSTAMQTDANGSPVQPVSPPTGAAEQGLANMDTFNPNIYGNSNTGVLPDGTGGVTNPYWDSGTRPQGAPPIGSGYGGGNPYPVNPSQIQPGGSNVYVAPDGSIFMPSENGNSFIMVPKNTNPSNVNTQPNKGKNSNSNVNVSTPPPANTAVKPPANTAAGNTAPPEAKPSPTAPKVKATPVPKIVPKPEVTPKTDTAPPATTEKRPQSGKQQDT